MPSSGVDQHSEGLASYVGNCSVSSLSGGHGGTRMTSIQTLRAAPAGTTDRVIAAWADAPPVARRAVAAACVISAALGSAVTAPIAVRWSIAAVGVLLTVAAMVDVQEHKLPNRLLLGALLVVRCALGRSIEYTTRASIPPPGCIQAAPSTRPPVSKQAP